VVIEKFANVDSCVYQEVNDGTLTNFSFQISFIYDIYTLLLFKLHAKKGTDKFYIIYSYYKKFFILLLIP